MRPINPESKIQKFLARAKASPGEWCVFDVKSYPATDSKIGTVAWERRYVREPGIGYVTWARYVKGVAVEELAG